MTDKPETTERSLLDEIEELQVLEAEELQEGVAFHAFRFKAAAVLEAITISIDADTTRLAKRLKLPNGATLMDVQKGQMRILFDPAEVKPAAVKKAIVIGLGRSKAKAKVAHERNGQVAIVPLQRWGN